MFANIAIFIGYCLAYGINRTLTIDATREGLTWIIFAFNMISLGLWFITFWFNNKDIEVMRAIMPKKLLRIYWSSHIAYFASFLFCLTLFFILGSFRNIPTDTYYLSVLIPGGILTLFVVAFGRYATWKMEFFLYKRKSLLPKSDVAITTDLTVESDKQVTSGLTDHSESKE
ncbi:MAG: hypothetical protein LBC33_03290 [Mycoplasmataceae bacterium]|nr:hypothetical protein [Mycoplasmataceae bacterium]